MQNHNKSPLFPKQCLHYGALAVQKGSTVEIGSRSSGVHTFWLKNNWLFYIFQKMVLSCRRECRSLQKCRMSHQILHCCCQHGHFGRLARRSQNTPRMIPTWVQNGSNMGAKMGPKWVPTWVPTWVRIRFQNGFQRGFQNGFQNGFQI